MTYADLLLLSGFLPTPQYSTGTYLIRLSLKSLCHGRAFRMTPELSKGVSQETELPK